jgi:hypothetical protein
MAADLPPAKYAAAFCRISFSFSSRRTTQLHDLGVLLARCPVSLAALDLVLAPRNVSGPSPSRRATAAIDSSPSRYRRIASSRNSGDHFDRRPIPC